MNCNKNLDCNFNPNNNNSNCFMGNYNCFCTPYEQGTEFNQLAKAFVLFQKFCGVLPLNEALVKGTAFEELYSPYMPINKPKKNKNC